MSTTIRINLDERLVECEMEKARLKFDKDKHLYCFVEDEEHLHPDRTSVCIVHGSTCNGNFCDICGEHHCRSWCIPKVEKRFKFIDGLCQICDNDDGNTNNHYGICDSCICSLIERELEKKKHIGEVYSFC